MEEHRTYEEAWEGQKRGIKGSQKKSIGRRQMKHYREACGGGGHGRRKFERTQNHHFTITIHTSQQVEFFLLLEFDFDSCVCLTSVTRVNWD